MSKSFALSQQEIVYENFTETAADAEGPFKVVLTTSYYGWTEVSELAGMDDVGKPHEFQTQAEAQEWIASAAGSQDASKDPTYTIVTHNTTPAMPRRIVK